MSSAPKKPRTKRGLSFRPKATGPKGLPSASERAPALPWALGSLLRFVDAQRPATHLEAVQRLDRAQCLVLRHVDECEAARLAGFPVVDELYRFHLAMT